VDVSVDGAILTVTAQRSERTEHDVQWLSCERFTGSYMRRLSLGADVDADHIAATYHNGVLTVTLPVAARAKPDRIEISHGAREETKVIEPSESSKPRPNPASPDGVQAGDVAGRWQCDALASSAPTAP
jgi:HSP20 family protein